jgi:hypothetical protein
VALKPAEFYGNLAALAAKCPPGSSQAKFYTDVADMVLTILKDADVSPLGAPPMTTPTGGPVAGLGKLL